jgi:hypothetical protein
MIGVPLPVTPARGAAEPTLRASGTSERPQLDGWVATGLDYAPFRWICSSTKLRPESTAEPS